MPRHNLYKVAALVQSLCKKHHIPYTVKPLFTAFGDIVRWVMLYKYTDSLEIGINAMHSVIGSNSVQIH